MDDPALAVGFQLAHRLSIFLSGRVLISFPQTVLLGTGGPSIWEWGSKVKGEADVILLLPLRCRYYFC